MRLDAYRGQLNALVQQHQYLSASRADHQRAKESLEGLDRLGAEDPDLLIPVGGETFVRGRPTAGTRVLIGMGSGIVAELERPKVIELIAERLTKIDKASQDLEGQIRSLDERVQSLTRRLEAVTQGGAALDAGPSPSDDVGGD